MQILGRPAAVAGHPPGERAQWDCPGCLARPAAGVTLRARRAKGGGPPWPGGRSRVSGAAVPDQARHLCR